VQEIWPITSSGLCSAGAFAFDFEDLQVSATGFLNRESFYGCKDASLMEELSGQSSYDSSEGEDFEGPDLDGLALAASQMQELLVEAESLLTSIESFPLQECCTKRCLVLKELKEPGWAD
jgi:hypothetical protein